MAIARSAFVQPGNQVREALMEVWGMEVDVSLLNDDEICYLNGLPCEVPAVEWVWAEMDRIWDEIGLDNRESLHDQPIGEFYEHPVWIMNGIFTGTDSVSCEHREAIAQFLRDQKAEEVADIGGGFGQLARAIRDHPPEVSVTVWDPYPSPLALKRFADDRRVQFVESPGGRNFDALVAQDVLEHVEDPICLAREMAHACRQDGLLIFANCFRPVVKCHLPCTFHLRHTFPLVMKAMGLEYLGRVEGAGHAQVFRRADDLNLAGARRAERISKVVGPALNPVRKCASRFKRALVGL